MIAIHRVKQFFSAITAYVHEEEIVILEQQLKPAQRKLFDRMSVVDQRHSFDVFHTLVRQGYTDHHLLQAALLHDAGKAEVRLRIWHRILSALLEDLCPLSLEKLALNQPDSWRYAFYVYKDHAELSAELAKQAGCSPVVVELIRLHHTRSENKQVGALWEADKIN